MTNTTPKNVFEDEVICPKCGFAMYLEGSHYRCPNCNHRLTTWQVYKKKNKKKSRADIKLETLMKNGKLELR